MPATTGSTRRGLHGKMKSNEKSQELSPCPCGSCGGLECLCRPRFFSGQLLTDEDLNRLDNYIRAKNRLHNLYLNGWGTVCGLEVLCDKCTGFVKVTSGYAIDPCGNDIIVCKDEKVEVCKLIGHCRDKKTHPCDPIGTNRNGNDDDKSTEEWLLYIEYVEKAQRGVTAIRGASMAPCCDSCAEGRPCECGCGNACGCKCAEKSNGHAHRNGTSKLRPAPAQCEPTVICESYRFGVCRKPEIRTDSSDSAGPLCDRFLECVMELSAALVAELDEEDGIPKDFPRAFRILQRFLDEHPGTFCEFPTFEDSDNQLYKYLIAVITYLLDCFCRAWIPPCPEVACDGRVPLATLTVSSGKCKIIRICNLTLDRRFVRTPQNVAYWLSPFQIVTRVRMLLEWICCELFDFADSDTLGRAEFLNATAPSSVSGSAYAAAVPGGIGGGTTTTKNPTVKIKPLPGGNSTKRKAGDMLDILTKARNGLDLRDLYRSLTNARDKDGNRTGSIKDIGNVPLAMMVNAIGVPLWEELAPDKIVNLPSFLQTLLGGVQRSETVGTSRRTVRAAESSDQPSTDEVAALRSELDELKAQVKKLREKMKR